MELIDGNVHWARQAFRCALRERGSTRGSSMALDALRHAAHDAKAGGGAAEAEPAGRGLAATLSRERGLHGASCNCYSVCHCFNVRRTMGSMSSCAAN